MFITGIIQRVLVAANAGLSHDDNGLILKLSFPTKYISLLDAIV